VGLHRRWCGQFLSIPRRHEAKTSAAGPRSDLDKFVDNLDDLSIHASTAKIEMESASGVTSSGAATTRFQSKDSRNRSRLGSRNLATDLQEADISESLSVLEKDLDFLLQLEGQSHRMSGGFGLFWRQ
jgi:hypothetical protein